MLKELSLIRENTCRQILVKQHDDLYLQKILAGDTHLLYGLVRSLKSGG